MKRVAMVLGACVLVWLVFSALFFVFGGFLLIESKRYLLFAGIAAVPVAGIGMLALALANSSMFGGSQ